MASAARLTPEVTAGLAKLAVTAQRDLGCDAVAVTTKARGTAEVAAFTGLKPVHIPHLRPALHDAARLAAHGIIAFPALASEDFGRADRLIGVGYASILTAPIRVGESAIGAIHLLRKEPGVNADRGLITALASHAGIMLAGSRHRRKYPLFAPPLAQLAALDRLTLSIETIQELAPALERALAPFLGKSVMTGLMLFDEERDILQMVPGSFGADEKTAASYQIKTINSRSNAARVFSTGQPYLSNSARGDPAILQDYVDAFGIRRILSLMLKMDEHRLGVFHIANKETDFTVGDLRQMEALAPRVAAVVAAVTRVLQLQRQKQVEQIIANVAVAIASGQSIHDFLTVALDELCVVAEANLIAFVQRGEAPVVWRRLEVDPRLENAVIAQARGITRARADVIGPQHAGDPGWSAFHVPVRLADQLIGTLSTFRARAEAFGSTERHALSRLADLAALAWTTERYQQQRAALARLDERARLADDLHDDVAQILFGAQLSLDASLQNETLDQSARLNIARARALIIRSDEALRSVIHQLSGPVVNDLPRRLAAVVVDVERDFSLPVHLEIDDCAAAATSQLRRPEHEALIKIARECLINAAKHAGPCRATVKLQRSGARLILTVVDDGVGMTDAVATSGHGLSSLRRTVRSHGGLLRVYAAQSGGTKILTSFPLPSA